MGLNADPHLQGVSKIRIESFGQISSRPHTTDWPPKGSIWEGKSHDFREIQVGEILEFGQNHRQQLPNLVPDRAVKLFPRC